MKKNGDLVSRFERIPTGIQGFDTLLKGGFLKGGVYLVMGSPGAGKTIIANQLAFKHAEAKGRALYVTLLAETQSRMFGNLSSLEFFNEDAISDSVVYLGGYGVLEKEGLNGLLKMLGEAVRKFKATMLFIDGVASAEDVALSPLAFKKFVHQLNSVLSTSGCTTFLLSSLDTGASHPEHTMVDGIISIDVTQDELRDYRQIEIRKFRGSDHLKGRHFFTISNEGVKIYPRIESYLGDPTIRDRESDERKKFNIAELDEMLAGGIVSGSTTSLLGPAGSGKTTLGTQFLLAGAESGERALYFSIYESPSRWRRKMERLGIKIDRFLKSGMLEVLWRPQTEAHLDQILFELLENIKTRKVKRLFFDGIGGMREAMFGRDRLHRALAAFANELRAMEVTTLFTEETEIFVSEVSAPISNLSAVTDSVLFLRQVEIDSELRRFISIIKTRESYADRKIREIYIDRGGIKIGDTFCNVQAVMTGVSAVTKNGDSNSTKGGDTKSAKSEGRSGASKMKSRGSRKRS